MLVSAKDDTSRVGVVAVNLSTATLKLKTIFNTVREVSYYLLYLTVFFQSYYSFQKAFKNSGKIL